MISSSKQGFEEESISDMRRSLTSAPFGMAVAAPWRCQEPQNFGRADRASTHWAMESSSTQLLNYFQTETELKQSSSKLKQDAALMGGLFIYKTTLICCTNTRSGNPKMPN